jgi:hypothetical protein
MAEDYARITLDGLVPQGPTYQDDLNRLSNDPSIRRIVTALDQVQNRTAYDVVTTGKVSGLSAIATEADMKEADAVLAQLELTAKVARSLVEAHRTKFHKAPPAPAAHPAAHPASHPVAESEPIGKKGK